MAADFPVFWGHGRADEEIPFEYAEEAISFLQRIGTRAPLLLKVYDDLDHSTNVNEVQDLATWLAEVTG
jgi:lysophospholipase-2